MAEPTRVRIIHQTDPRKYFPAIHALAANGEIELVGEHRYSVLKEWARSWARERRPLGRRTRDAISDLWLRLRLPTIHDEVVVLGCAPWDVRMVLYGYLGRRNRLVYHTSWPFWEAGRGPRRYGPLTPLLRRHWLKVLRRRTTSVVTVLGYSEQRMAESYGLAAVTIPHAVPEAFFEARRPVQDHGQGPLRLLFVGELATKKGLPSALALMAAHPERDFLLTIVGDGPLRGTAEAAARRDERITVTGPIRDKVELARVVAAQDVLVLLSRREGFWEELFGIVIVEAAAAGLGVVATSHIGPEAILGAAGLENLFDQDDAAGPEKLLLGLLEDPARRQEFCAAHTALATPYLVSEVSRAWAAVLTGERA